MREASRSCTTPTWEHIALRSLRVGTRPSMKENRTKIVWAARVMMAACFTGSLAGCGAGSAGWHAPRVSKIFAPAPLTSNPLVVPSTDFEIVWNKTVAVVDKYFDIESENRLARTIRTQPQMGATMLEPWALDSATLSDRLEATLQTIRRVAAIHVAPAPARAFLGYVEM